MLLIVEIILTIVAWRRGWMWYSLIPVGIGVTLGFLIGVSAASSGSTIDAASPGFIIIDLIICVALGIMAGVGKVPPPEIK
jgi:Na+/phosphate symporter